jgi:hypothetical protein
MPRLPRLNRSQVPEFHGRHLPQTPSVTATSGDRYVQEPGTKQPMNQGSEITFLLILSPGRAAMPQEICSG